MNCLQWSKTKSTLESFLCDKLKERVKIYATVYRKFHDRPGRVWITLDGKEILSASDVTYEIKHETLYEQIKEERDLKPIPYSSDWKEMFNSKECQELWKASDEAKEIIESQNIFTSYHLYEPFMEYSSVSIDEAINSNNVITRAFAMFDRRLGKRRLKTMQFTEGTNPLIKKFYNIRCEAEGLYKV